MARKVRDDKLGARSTRLDSLKPRREPYWRKIALGAHLGYRRAATGGTWIGRWRDPNGGQRRYEAIGPADDHADADGVRVFSFDQAQEEARKIFTKLARQAAGDFQPTGGPYTVAMAMADYLKFRKSRGDKSVEIDRSKVTSLVVPSLGDMVVAKLTKTKLEAWLAELADTPARVRVGKGQAQKFRAVNDPRARRATVNRVLALLKAALNRAHEDGKVPHDDAWRKVKPFKAVSVARPRILTDDELRRFLNACAPDFRKIATAAILTGARYSELARVVADDFSPDAGTVYIRFPKAGPPRHVVLTEEAQAYFAKLVTGRMADALLFTRDDGAPWKRSNQQNPMRDACVAARIVPLGFHQLRHTHASRLIQRGASLSVAAAQLGHKSTKMVELHYGHLQPGHVAETVRKAFGELGIGEADNVRPLRPKRSGP
jgi:integrase